MSMRLYFLLPAASLLFVFIFCGQVYAAKPLPVAATEDKNEKLDKQFHKFSAEFYSQYIRHENVPIANAMDQLNTRINGHTKNKEVVKAVAMIVRNYSLLAKNPNDPKIVGFIAILLEQNEWKTANRLYAVIKEDADKTLIANVSYLFAKYHFARNQWRLTLDILDSVASDLPQELNHHAIIMQGIAFQRLKYHRSALVYYEKIPVSSKYYTIARLNMAIANIRQDWWTDAHTLIEGLIKNPKVTTQTETVDRLYTVLGYSFLREQYYRNSRDAFRNVGLDSPYANRALLGIALTAANQEDFVGALNAVSILKGKDAMELPVEEAHLLTPYFYERLKQHTTAATGYNEAIQFYEQRINKINHLIDMDISAYKTMISFDDKQKLLVDKQIVDISNKVPESFISNYKLLTAYRPLVEKIAADRLLREYKDTEANYLAAMQELVRTVLNERITQLTSYMNQSRYGIARLYDNKESTN